MSISEFKGALKNKALQEWFKKEKAGGGSSSVAEQNAYRLENINVLVNPVSIYRAGEQTSEKTAFLITKDTIRDLLVQYHGIDNKEVLKDLTDEYFKKFSSKNKGVAVSRRRITVAPDLPAVYFPNISFDTITKLVNNIMSLKSAELAKYYEKGHILGLTTELLQATASRIELVDTRGSSGKAFLLQQLDNVIAYYKRLDLDSANLQPAGDVKVYASVVKDINKKGKSRYLVELQPKTTNQASAREVQATIGSIRKLFSPGTLSEKAILELISTLQKSVSDPKFQQDLLEMKSSPKFADMVAQLLVGILRDTPIDQQYSHKDVFIASKKVVKPDLSKVRAEAKKQIAAAEKAKKTLNARPPIRNTQGRFASLASLQTVLNLALHDQIQKNMGTGSRRDVLNYRTGRFAKSAEVTKMSQSREGMITAFYTYMKNPYATFSEGGAQSIPRSRDPKLLISKSVRELLSKQVNNRMRAVLV